MSKPYLSIAFALIGLVGSVRPGSAQCANADPALCTVAECQNRQARVHPTCDVSRTCANTSSANKVELRRRLTLNQQCLAARLAVNGCFAATDQGHQQQIDQINASIAACQAKIDE